MNTNGQRINHIPFADDTIIFCNGRKKTFEMMHKTLKVYEELSGQLLNKEKVVFLTRCLGYPLVT